MRRVTLVRARSIGSAIFLPLVLAACSSPAPSAPSGPGDQGGQNAGNGTGNGNGTGTGKGTGTGTGNNGTPTDGGASSSSGGPSNGSGNTTGPQLYLWSDSINGGFDGKDPFVIPTSAVMVQGTDQNATPVPFTTPPTFTIDDTSVATIAATPAPNIPEAKGDPFFQASAFALITPKKAGTATLTVSAQGQTVKAQLNITAYTPDQVTLGETRYTNPANPGAQRVACKSCHAPAPGVDAGINAPKHDPFFQQDLTDGELLVIIEKGLYDINDPNSKLNVPGGHTWNLTADEEKAIPAYLRSIKPEGF